MVRRGSNGGPFWATVEDEVDGATEQGVLQWCCMAIAGSVSGAVMTDF